jgi:hypothetical protein
MKGAKAPFTLYQILKINVVAHIAIKDNTDTTDAASTDGAYL